MYIKIPEDDERRDGGRCVGKLNKALYGTRDAPAVWQRFGAPDNDESGI